MANHLTSAQRYNDKLDKIWQTARDNGTLSRDNESEEAIEARYQEFLKNNLTFYKKNN